ncbi:hypothetical protein Salat_1184600 [Sesamum alatum]|uniref:Uncharacterized protein n=1 Tax=Sesamum alatum TaxID=300844 RepID=A0AAE1YEZ9_9LAMI|nr:hypothetical protein Salat_1184600 [Sesamum alatum]
MGWPMSLKIKKAQVPQPITWMALSRFHPRPTGLVRPTLLILLHLIHFGTSPSLTLQTATTLSRLLIIQRLLATLLWLLCTSLSGRCVRVLVSAYLQVLCGKSPLWGSLGRATVWVAGIWGCWAPYLGFEV